MYKKLFIIAPLLIWASSVSASERVEGQKEIESTIQYYEQLLINVKKSHSSGAPSLVNYYEGYKADLQNLLQSIKATDDVNEKLYEIHLRHDPCAAASHY